MSVRPDTMSYDYFSEVSVCKRQNPEKNSEINIEKSGTLYVHKRVHKKALLITVLDIKM